jgi:ferric-chelate reductase
MDDHHPSLLEVVRDFMEERAVGAFRTRVVASGPRGMGSDLRAAVACVNDGRKVWKGDARYDVDLEWEVRK